MEEVDFKRKGVGLVNANSDSFAAYKTKRNTLRSRDQRIDRLETKVKDLESQLKQILRALESNGKTNIQS